MSIWQFQKLLSERLLRWSWFSIIAGIALLRSGAFWRGFGAQAIGWGVIDAAIAMAGDRLNKPSGDAAEAAKQSRNLRMILLVNTCLDVLYMQWGRSLARRSPRNAFMRGTGWGIVMQGMFLFFFDLLHLVNVPDEDNH